MTACWSRSAASCRLQLLELGDVDRRGYAGGRRGPSRRARQTAHQHRVEVAAMLDVARCPRATAAVRPPPRTARRRARPTAPTSDRSGRSRQGRPGRRSPPRSGWSMTRSWSRTDQRDGGEAHDRHDTTQHERRDQCEVVGDGSRPAGRRRAGAARRPGSPGRTAIRASTTIGGQPHHVVDSPPHTLRLRRGAAGHVVRE